MTEPKPYKERINDLRSMLESMKSRMAEVLPRHMTPERMVKTALIAVNRQPELLDCTVESFAQAMMTASELGLDVSGSLGSAYLVPFNVKDRQTKQWRKQVQFIPGYRGLIDLARRSGQIAQIEARVVYENDDYECVFGIDQVLRHRPKLQGDRGAILGVYAIARLTDGAIQIEPMTKEEVDAVRERSRAKNSGPWVTDYPEMARKTVVRRIMKYLPLSAEMAKAFEAEDRAEGAFERIVDVEERARTTPEIARDASESLADQLEAARSERSVEMEEPAEGEQEELPMSHPDRKPTDEELSR